ncbi:response regulator transcription factor [uncultured Sphaerochaeta sp.]|uniref:response regulator transcription factor n=1 Tax=uncultured Sphaerochaeta sp. TaxID=886478 RepID=UPI002A0A82F9|nr:response regulator transcription factor [uncultured Sphaerochaeta sp.]
MIYIVEDNDSIRETIRAYLEISGYTVQEFDRVSGVLEAFDFKPPELCILDVMLPDGNGFELAKKIRSQRPGVAFLFLTARESESDRITGLELGAEDYIVKPFSPRELVLRVQLILRRVEKDGQANGKIPTVQTVKFWKTEGHLLAIDSASHEVFLDGAPVHLTAVEWKILSWLADKSGILVSRERILGECLDYSHDGSERTVNTHLKNLRAKLGGLGWIETIRGFGYKFIGEPNEGPETL